MPPDNVRLLKLIWHPDDFRNGKLHTTAFRRDDLCGDGIKHVSVDRKDLAKREVMESVVQGQRAKANGTTVLREDARIGILETGEVRATKDSKDGSRSLFSVTSQVIPGNDAHCGIMNISGANARGDVDELRGKLVRLVAKIVTIAEAYT